MQRAHPSSIRFSPDGHDGDDHSEITGPDDHWQDDDLLGNMASDLHYSHNFWGLLPSSPEKREILQLKIQLARQQGKLQSLSSKLSRCEEENEALEAENNALVDELALAVKKPTATKREEWPTIEWPTIESTLKDDAGPIRQLVDFNAALTAENARLQAVVDVTRKSFKAHIRGSRKRRDEDRQTIETLRLRREGKDLRRSSGEHTARTSLISSFAESVADDSLRWGPVREVDFRPAGDECIAEGEEIERAETAHVRKRAPRARRRTVDCASSKDTKRGHNAGARDGSEGSGVDGPHQRPARRGRRRTADDGAEDLFVGFNEARRSFFNL